MITWNNGYVSDTTYINGYYPEMFPARLRFLLTAAGFECPAALEKGGYACELGFGMGTSLNINAAASPLIWYGTDFNPAQTGFARKMAAASGAPVTAFDQSFEDFCSREGLPDFDLICLHGIWSWISRKTQQDIVDFIRRKLNVGGIVYISYNCAPGWTPYVPMQEIFSAYASQMMPAGQNFVAKAQGAIQFMEKILELTPLYDRAFPGHKAKLEQIKQQDLAYVAHEYLNQNWQICFFHKLARQLAEAKISYACSAGAQNYIPTLNYSREQMAFLRTIPDSGLREYLSDFMTCNNFRWDIWGKGLTRLSARDQRNILEKQEVMLLTPPRNVTLEITGKRGKAILQESFYKPILDALDQYQVKQLGDLPGENLSQVLEAVFCLIAKGNLAVINPHDTARKLKKYSDALNNWFLSQLSTGRRTYLSSPLAGGIHVSPVGQMALNGFLSGARDPKQLTDKILQQLQARGQNLVENGEEITDEAERQASVEKTATAFFEKNLALYKALMIL